MVMGTKVTSAVSFGRWPYIPSQPADLLLFNCFSFSWDHLDLYLLKLEFLLCKYTAKEIF